LLLIGRVPDVQSGWLVRSVLLSGATGPNQDHLTVPNHRPVPPTTSRLRATGHLRPSGILTRSLAVAQKPNPGWE